MNTTETVSTDPFAGWPPTPIYCKWDSPEDARLAPTADIIRVIVDHDRWGDPGCVNAVYQQNVIRDLLDFIGPSRAVLVTPAGMISTSMGWLADGVAGIDASLEVLQNTLNLLDTGAQEREVLLGMDACIPSEAVPLQTVVHLRGRTKASLANTAFKIYPSGQERQFLMGYRYCQELSRVPTELARGRVAQTAAGPVLILVCFDAGIFSSRSFSNLQDPLGLTIRQHFLELANARRPKYVVIATHWLDKNPRGGAAFLQAASYLVEKTGGTVVTTTFAPLADLAQVARRFAIKGPSANKVATLLVGDNPP